MSAHDSEHPNRDIIITLTLLVIALLGPVFHWAGLWLRGSSFFYISFTRLVLAYVFLAGSAAGAAWLIWRPSTRMVRLLAAAGLVMNIASIAYAGRIWRAGSQLLTSDTVWAPFTAGRVGIVIAPAGEGALALAEARVIEETITRLLDDTELKALVETRQVTTIFNAESAEQVARRMHAAVVIWGIAEGSELVRTEHYITTLGAETTASTLDIPDVMRLLASIGTLNIADHRLMSENAVPPTAREVLAPSALGFAALAAQKPALAAGYYQAAMSARSLPVNVAQDLTGYYSLVLLTLNRPDLAKQALEQIQPPVVSATALLAQGALSFTEGDIDSAEGAYLQARALMPSLAQAYCGLAVVEGQRGNIRRARALSEQAIALQPDWGLLYLVHAHVLELQGDAGASLAAYNRAKECLYPFESLRGLVLERERLLSVAPPSPVPTASIAPTPSPMPIPGQRYHTVAKGETLRKIAADYGVTEAALVKLNNLKDENVLYIGQVLLIPED